MQDKTNIFERFIEAVSKLLMAIGAIVLMMMMFLTAVDVGFRYVMNSPIPGALELVEYMMAILIPFSIAYCAFQRSHVAVELIFERFPKLFQAIIDITTKILTLLFVIAVTWENTWYVKEMYTSKMTSAVLLIPAYPFVIPTALGTLIFSLILISHLFWIFKEAKK